MVIVALYVCAVPQIISAAGCSKDGYTIEYINGINNTEEDTSLSTKALYKNLGSAYNGESLNIRYLYNPTHGFATDFSDAIKQKLLEARGNIQDADFVGIFNDAKNSIKTQKLLLVAHSQGNFYANTFYDTVVGRDGGLSFQSVGMYSVATPANRVSGGGEYITSSNDNVIAGIVTKTSTGYTLPANDTLKNSSTDNLGHGFLEIYLSQRPDKIITSIERALSHLVSDPQRSESTSCIAVDLPITTTVAISQVIAGGLAAGADQVIGNVVLTKDVAIARVKPVILDIGNTITDTARAIGSFTRNVAKGLFFGGQSIVDSSTAAIILATDASAQVPHVAIPPTPVTTTNNNTAPATGTSNYSSSQVVSPQSPESSLSDSTTTSTVIALDASPIIVEDSPLLQVSTITPTKTPLASVYAYSGGGGGGGASPQPAPQEPSTMDTSDAEEAPASTISTETTTTLLPDGILSATTTVQTYTENPVAFSGEYYNNTTFDTIAFEIKNIILDTATTSIARPAQATTTGEKLSFSENIEIPSSGAWQYRVRLEDSVNASSTPWLESETFSFAFATTTTAATTTPETIEAAPSVMTFELPNSANLLYSDLNGNGIADSTETDVIATTTQSLAVGEYQFNNLTIPGGVNIVAEGNPDSSNSFKGVKIFAKNLTVNAKAYISADGQGYREGPGAGVGEIAASYGGVGGSNTGVSLYGSATKPVDLGSGTGGARGGGAIKIIVTDTFLNNGTISANGQASRRASGGSIYVTARNLAGNGVFNADGAGSEWPYRFGGGGGRIAVYYEQSTFSGDTTVNAGKYCFYGCNAAGGAGTAVFFDVANNDIYPKSSFVFQANDAPFNFHNISLVNGGSAGIEEGVNITADNISLQNGSSLSVNDKVIINARELSAVQNSSVSLGGTPILNTPSVVVGKGSTLSLLGGNPIAFDTLTIQDGGTLVTDKEKVLSLIVSNLTVSSGSSISANLNGYGPSAGSGAPSSSSGGAGHGGGGYGPGAGATYGSTTQPLDFGSGGGAPRTSAGGAIRIVSTGVITNNGTISANGDVSSSGGSIYLTANDMTGSGSFHANGGWISGGGYYSGPGGGGRVAVYYRTSTFTGVTEVLGGCGSYDGWSRVCAGSGTVVMEQIIDTPIAPPPLAPALSSKNLITAFDLLIATSTVPGIIDEGAHTISLTVPFDTDVQALTPMITVSAFATSSPASGVVQDFTTPVIYSITAEDGTTQAYTVTVTTEPAPAPLLETDTTPPIITSYSFNGAQGDITADFATTTPSVNLMLTADENVDWVSIRIEDQNDSTKDKIFFSGAECVDDTTTCAKSWDGILSPVAEHRIAPDGVYRIKVHMEDMSPAKNSFEGYLSPYFITVKTATSTPSSL